jgi:4-diphosphocytidyl-2-C-methyl-D-erythritol kinase
MECFLYIIYPKIYISRLTMNYLEIPAHAKINISLDVLRKREDGYHELRMIMQTLELHDTVCLEAAGESISLECGSKWVPEDRTNTAWAAADLMKRRFGIKDGLRIRIVKRIPVAAGLAGGSSDAAAVLRGMNEMFGLGLGNEELRKLGKLIGADVPYCIEGGTRLAEGIGEILTELPSFAGVDTVLAMPGIGVSTPWVYRNLRLSEIKTQDRPDTDLLKEAIKRRDIRTVAENMKNVLELVTIRRYDIIGTAKKQMVRSGAAGSLMSGSGPAVFGLFMDTDAADAAYEDLSAFDDWQLIKTRTV